MIITVTLNAAIDKSLSVPSFRLGRRHRTVERRALAKKLGQAFQSQNRNFGHGLSHGSNGQSANKRRIAACPLARVSRCER